ncbi:capsular polysaccharide biosynthesis protein [Mucilaginibacter gynuensis]|uniref:protein-tyrosine-phosphatase n=1 Tax=Mucilaginibacter gynuensis TaxID=1302236 RepID=A0ABP8GXK3_9SPHI
MFNFFKKSLVQVDFDFIGTDIHSHLLPGLDDGSPDVESSVNYISALRNLGFSSFICTPHIFMELYPNNRQTISAALTQLQSHQFIKDNNIKISAAAEYMVNMDFGPLVEQADMMLLPNKHILIEMSYLSETPGIEDYVFELNLQGYKPILAHPERYTFYHAKPERIDRFKDMGCLLQLNLLSVTGYYGRDVKHTALKLLKNNAYDLGATDFHHQEHLNAFQSQRLWKDTYDHLSKYPFRNKELFGL